jgi:prepilin-type N-terminal cleavage/methylation domain-containing protein
MLIFTCMKPVKEIRALISRNSKPLTHNDQGFTLIEILVALVLVGFIITISLPSGNNSRNELDRTLEQIERSIRFASDEATLRNVIVRVNFKLDEDPQEFSIEYGPNAHFVPPPRAESDLDNLGVREREIFEQQQQRLAQQFNRIRELNEGKFEVSDLLRINGLGAMDSEVFVNRYEASLYVYPTGEKDHSFVILSSDEEFATLEIEPFTMNFKREYILHNFIDNFEDRDRQAKEIFNQWRSSL